MIFWGQGKLIGIIKIFVHYEAGKGYKLYLGQVKHCQGLLPTPEDVRNALPPLAKITAVICS